MEGASRGQSSPSSSARSLLLRLSQRGRRRIEEKLSEEAEKAGTEEDEVVELLQEAASMLEVVGNDAAPQSTRTYASSSLDAPLLTPPFDFSP